MSISAGFCDLRQVIQRRGTRAEARAIIEKLAKTVDESLKRAEGERDALDEIMSCGHPKRMVHQEPEGTCWCLGCEAESRARENTSRLERATEKLDVILANAPLVELMLEDGSVTTVKAFLADGSGEKP